MATLGQSQLGRMEVDSGDFQYVAPSKRSNNNNCNKSLYIGNLPSSSSSDEIIENLVRLVQECELGVSISTTHIALYAVGRPSCHAIVTWPYENDEGPSLEAVITRLHRSHWPKDASRSLVVQKERKRREGRNNNNNRDKKGSIQSQPKSFGLWSKPKNSKARQQAHRHRMDEPSADHGVAMEEASAKDPVLEEQDPVLDDWETSMADLVSEEMKDSSMDPVSTAVIATAAITMATQAMLWQQQQQANLEMQLEELEPIGSSVQAQQAQPKQVDRDVQAFHYPKDQSFDARLSQNASTMAALLDEYGAQDVNWRQQVPSSAFDVADSSPGSSNRIVKEPDDLIQHQQQQEQQQQQNGASMLLPHGKAPIHVHVCTFGYHYGVPPESLAHRHGWSYAHPSPPFDCRDLITVPKHLAWQDGLSGSVKYALLKAPAIVKPNTGGCTDEDPDTVRKRARKVIDQIKGLLLDAIDQGGFGYALPLQMQIWIGSELGRHRSVVLAELVATGLRQWLRQNTGNRIAQPCSIGSMHRDIERRMAIRKKQSDRDEGSGNDDDDAKAKWKTARAVA